MKPSLHSPQGVAALNRLLRERVLIAFDFDGTLAPICADPEQARIPVTWRKWLVRINQHWPLAVISGRELGDLAPRLGFEPAFIAGNHGAESAAAYAAPATDTAHAPTQCLIEARTVLAGQTASIHALGIEVEDKRMSLAVHYRRSSRPPEAAAFLAQLLAALPPELTVSHGRAVFNITVRAAPDKGNALLSAMRASSVAHTLFVGDDVNDEPAFAAASPGSVTVRIGSRRSPTCARFALDTHRQLGLLLRTLAMRSR